MASPNEPPRRDWLSLALYAYFVALIGIVIVMLYLTVIR